MRAWVNSENTCVTGPLSCRYFAERSVIAVSCSALLVFTHTESEMAGMSVCMCLSVNTPFSVARVIALIADSWELYTIWFTLYSTIWFTFIYDRFYFDFDFCLASWAQFLAARALCWVHYAILLRTELKAALFMFIVRFQWLADGNICNYSLLSNMVYILLLYRKQIPSPGIGPKTICMRGEVFNRTTFLCVFLAIFSFTFFRYKDIPTIRQYLVDWYGFPVLPNEVSCFLYKRENIMQ